jgi:pyridoxamine 5'-phosphate oxidase
VIVDGVAERVSREDSEAYFATRPRGAQISAWASEQSQPVASRAELEARHRAVEAECDGRGVPCPPHWGGYLVRPRTVEFWQGRNDRLHDRLRYLRSDPARSGPVRSDPARSNAGRSDPGRRDAGWTVERLAP